MDDSNSRLDTAEEKMSELEDIAIVHILKEMQREKDWDKGISVRCDLPKKECNHFLSRERTGK